MNGLSIKAEWKAIKLTQNKWAMVDREDYEEVNKHRWHISGGANTNYTATRINRKKIRMHRLVMNPKKGECIDHVNGNGLDNRKENLRICSHMENNRAIPKTKNKTSSKYKGVTADKRYGRWIVQITHNYKKITLGGFNTEEEAGRVYDKLALKHHGEFASLNFPKEDYNANTSN